MGRDWVLAKVFLGRGGGRGCGSVKGGLDVRGRQALDGSSWARASPDGGEQGRGEDTWAWAPQPPLPRLQDGKSGPVGYGCPRSSQRSDVSVAKTRPAHTRRPCVPVGLRPGDPTSGSFLMWMRGAPSCFLPQQSFVGTASELSRPRAGASLSPWLGRPPCRPVLQPGPPGAHQGCCRWAESARSGRQAQGSRWVTQGRSCCSGGVRVGDPRGWAGAGC